MNQLQFSGINYLAVLVAWIVHVVTGLIWFRPKLFGNEWKVANWSGRKSHSDCFCCEPGINSSALPCRALFWVHGNKTIHEMQVTQGILAYEKRFIMMN